MSDLPPDRTSGSVSNDDATPDGGSVAASATMTEPPLDEAPPPASPPYRRLYRSTADRRIGGVAGGIAEYFGLDPTIVRLAVLVLAFSGIGLLAYLAAWIIVPSRPDGAVDPPLPPRRPSQRNVSAGVGIAAIAIAIGIITDSWWLLSVALIGGGIWLLSQQPVEDDGASEAPEPAWRSEPQAEPPSYEPPVEQFFEPTPTEPPPVIGEDWTPAPPRVREPQRITRIVFALLALLAGIAIAAAAGNWWDVSPALMLGIGIVIIGVGIVVGAFVGRGARGLVPLGILAALLLIPVSAVDGLIDDGIGDSAVRPLTLDDLSSSYRHGIGELTVDLSNLDLADVTETIEVDLGMGRVEVILPPDTGGVASLDADAGEIRIEIPGDSSDSDTTLDGINIETGPVSLQGETGNLTLDVHVGFGLAEVRVAGVDQAD